MADVKHLKDRGLPLKIDGATKFVRGATKYTTCSDVIKMVLKKLGIGKEYRHLFAIYEITKDGEYSLPGKTRVLKIAKEWDSDRNKFALRKISYTDNITGETETEPACHKGKTSKKQEHKLFSKITSALRPKSANNKDDKTEIKQQPKAEENIQYTTSDSDTSLEDFLSTINPSKMVEFIQFFNAMKSVEEQKLQQKSSIQVSGVSNQGEKNDHTRRGAQLKSCKRLSRSRSKKRGHARRKTLTDVHPSKIHSVQRLDYGFLDSNQDDEDVTKDSVIDDGMSSECESTFQRQTFRLKRYFRQGQAKSHDIKHFESDKDMKHLHETEVNNMLAQSFTTRVDPNKPQSNYHELWNEDFRREFDSAPESLSSDDSLDSNYRFQKDRTFDSCAEHTEADMKINKLVDYSFTDDELSEMETEDDAVDILSNGLDIGYCTAESSSVDINSSENHNTTWSSISECGYHVNKGFSSDSDSDVEMCGVAASSSLKKHRHSVNTSDLIRNMFAKHTNQSEDDEMDSFMKSKVFDESLGDGLSWLQSDDEISV